MKGYFWGMNILFLEKRCIATRIFTSPYAYVQNCANIYQRLEKHSNTASDLQFVHSVTSRY